MKGEASDNWVIGGRPLGRLGKLELCLRQPEESSELKVDFEDELKLLEYSFEASVHEYLVPT
jgi:hypothetical protein